MNHITNAEIKEISAELAMRARLLFLFHGVFHSLKVEDGFHVYFQIEQI
jgi:hypothetical protein